MFYFLEKEIQRRDKEISDIQIKGLHDMPFNPAKVKLSKNYEYPFLGKNETYTYNFLL